MAEGAARTGPGWLQARGPATTTVLLRHGETPLSGERRFAGRGDIPLTATGLEQAAAAARPAGRARRPRPDRHLAAGADPADRQRGRRGDRRARGGGGRLDGDRLRGVGGLSLAEAERGWPGQMAAWLDDTGAAPPGGESFAATSDRVLKALDSLLAEQAGATVLVVATSRR